jgi:hypothetical protein
MPRALRVLRAFFGLKATLSALTGLFVGFLLLSLYFYTPPGYREWLAGSGVSVPRLWGWALMYLLGTIAYTVAAVRLGKGGGTPATPCSSSWPSTRSRSWPTR